MAADVATTGLNQVLSGVPQTTMTQKLLVGNAVMNEGQATNAQQIMILGGNSAGGGSLGIRAGGPKRNDGDAHVFDAWGVRRASPQRAKLARGPSAPARIPRRGNSSRHTTTAILARLPTNFGRDRYRHRILVP